MNERSVVVVINQKSEVIVADVDLTTPDIMADAFIVRFYRLDPMMLQAAAELAVDYALSRGLRVDASGATRMAEVFARRYAKSLGVPLEDVIRDAE